MNDKKDEQTLYATQDGEIKTIEDISDSVFAMKALGDGICVCPTNGHVYAPMSGTLKVVADTKHAYGIVGEDGLEVMIHVGIDSVELNGKGITSYVSTGIEVEVGTILCIIDVEIFKSNNISTETAVVVTNKDDFEINHKYLGSAIAGETPIFTYIKK